MLFSSHVFIFVFLPATVAGFFAIARVSREGAALWLVAASLFFYGWWNPRYVPLLAGSIVFNYCAGLALARGARGPRWRKPLLVGAVAANLALLGYFKYAGFFAAAIADFTHNERVFGNIVLPLGISFFTFTQIAFLVDASRAEVTSYRFTHYALFVTYFPHLIAGPVLQHSEMIPQFRNPAMYRWSSANAAVGVTIFAIGLFKKVCLADGVAPFANEAFDGIAAGGALSPMEAWLGALAYALQLYFDFSGYSDMAVGISCLFGVRLPLNFYSPYRASSVIEFWRRWHMSLSRFLRDYLYVPLGGNRSGPARRYLNLWVTMLLGGLWHGAGWTFVAWGALHAAMLSINHVWRAFAGTSALGGRFGVLIGGAMTFFAVVLAWVMFRAPDASTAISMWRVMFGLAGPAPDVIVDIRAVWWVAALLYIVWRMPNTYQIMRRCEPVIMTYAVTPQHVPGALQWRARAPHAVAAAVIFAISVASLNDLSAFLYFQF
ncbi:MAG TPA: MBOAT family protein [Burkholderiales bacterium]|nr:MBOAT family protein [Burkholderiales bacterium]